MMISTKNVEKNKAYHDYIAEHINNVKRVWEDLKMHYPGSKDYNLGVGHEMEISYLIENHDLSKTSPSEFAGYRQWFYPAKNEQKSKSLFDMAWNHHQKSNPHHWQFWLMWKPEGTEALDIPFKYIIEMLCDWTAMSYKFGDTPMDFYKKTGDSMLLSESTRKVVEYWLPLFTALAEKKRGNKWT